MIVNQDLHPIHIRIMTFSLLHSGLSEMELASGVAGLISLGLELTTMTYNYITDVCDAPEESKELHDELIALLKGLEGLQKFLEA